jgi:hypothetical protein
MRRRVLAVGLGLLAALLLLVLVEGAASLFAGARKIAREAERPEIEESKHTRYDAELGWVNLEDVSLPDFYGPGAHLHTNARGFRGTAQVDVLPPAGLRRIICSGDSFTLGYGVADEDTWCAKLAPLVSDTETVNMGQGGYGIDQAYLWYQRDGLPLEHDVHVLAFIFDDFRRTGESHMLGHGKPLLVVGDDGELHNTNHPAPDHGYLRRWMLENGHLFRELRSVDLGVRALAKLRGEGPQETTDDEERIWRVVAAILDRLRVQHAERGSELVLLFLPTPWDSDTDLSLHWRTRVDDYAARHRVRNLDLVAETKRMDAAAVGALFIPEGEPGHPHLSEAGNAWVALRLANGLSD